PAVLERLRWMPFVSVVAVAILLSFGLWGLAIIRQAEKRSIWVGMAKETAHQLGTPLSSLMGWTDLLHTHSKGPSATETVSIPSAEFHEIVSEIERDTDRLNKVAQRFSQVGSTPQLQTQDATPVVKDVVVYMRKRTPKSSGDVEIRERYEPVPEVKLNAQLV